MIDKLARILGLGEKRSRFAGDYASFALALEGCDKCKGYHDKTHIASAAARALKIKEASEKDRTGCGHSTVCLLAAFLPVVMASVGKRDCLMVRSLCPNEVYKDDSVDPSRGIACAG